MISTLIACAMVAAAITVYWASLGMLCDGECGKGRAIGCCLLLIACLAILAGTAHTAL